MKQAVLVHGTGACPQSNWFPWLASELRKLEWHVTAPKFPTPQGQSLENWHETFNSNISSLTSGTVLIGHSIGCAFVLHLLSQTKFQIQAALMVAPFWGELGLPEFDPLNESFFMWDPKWDDLVKRTEQIFLYAGDNDPYVPLSRSKEVANKLHSTLTVIEGGGHLNAESGFTTFPHLLKALRTI